MPNEVPGMPCQKQHPYTGCKCKKDSRLVRHNRTRSRMRACAACSTAAHPADECFATPSALPCPVYLHVHTVLARYRHAPKRNELINGVLHPYHAGLSERTPYRALTQILRPKKGFFEHVLAKNELINASFSPWAGIITVIIVQG